MRETMISSPRPSHRIRRVLTSILPFANWREAGLNVASTIRVHNLTVLAKDEIARRLGELASVDRTALAEVLRRAFSLDQ
jgi:hypothetical protein